MMRFALASIGGAVLIVVAIWLCVRAAGTNWALPVFFVVFFAVYLGDAVVERRSRAKLTRLYRFEQREAERRRAA